MTRSMEIRRLVKSVLPDSVLDLYRSFTLGHKRLANFQIYQEYLRGQSGVEIGGPSIFFRHQLPIYPVVSALAGVNFSGETMWEGVIKAGEHFKYARNRTGRQFISEATELREIDSGQYQFLISSNCLEHVANPLKAIEEWIRVVEPGGFLLLVLPNKVANFDHRRPVTPFRHLLDDYHKNTAEDDMTHLAEILELHDLTRDPAAGGRDNFVKRSMENQRYRGMHHHVFDLALIEEMLSNFGVTLLLRDTMETDFVVLGQTAKSG